MIQASIGMKTFPINSSFKLSFLSFSNEIPLLKNKKKKNPKLTLNVLSFQVSEL